MEMSKSYKRFHDGTISSSWMSSLRPSSNFYTQKEVIDTIPITLERLPEEILQNIFENLNPTELLHLCSMSRALYLPAVMCLYKRIIITNPNSEYVRADVETWTNRKCTVTCKAEALVNSVSKNKVLASLIETIIIHKYNEENRCGWLPLISLCGNLRAYHNRASPFCDEAIYSVVFCATCHVEKIPIFGPNLTEVRLVYSSRRQSIKSFGEIAISMVYTSAFVNLKTLIIEHENPRLFGLEFQYMHIRAGYPPWIRFFEVFRAKKIKLNLETLGLDGYFQTEAERIASIILSAIDSSKLKTLDVTYNEDPHPGFQHRQEDVRSFSRGFLEFLTRHSKSLVNLSVDYRINCSICNRRFIRDATKYTMMDQLKQLSIHMSPIKDFDSVLQSITDYQSSLVKLEVQNGFASKPDLTPAQILRFWHPAMQTCVKFNRHYYTPVFNFTHHCHSLPVYEAEMFFRVHLKLFVWGLGLHDIRRHAFSPSLIEYSTDGFLIDLKRNRLILNGGPIDLAPFQIPSFFPCKRMHHHSED